MKSKLFCVLLTAIILQTYCSAQHNTYYIGHSGFGWDLIVGEMVNDLADDAGITTYDYNFQFIGGTCLTHQWFAHATPQGGTDSWVELSTGSYDYVVLAEQIPIQEVIWGSPWCDTNDVLTSVESVDNFYDMAQGANPNTRMYLMEFHNEVDQTATSPHADWVNLNANMRPLWEQVVDSVNLINNGPEVCIVPVAAAFQALADSVIAGVYPGTTNWIDLFDPNDTVVATIHPTEATYYLVACVHYATIFGQSPVGLTNQTYAALGWPFDPPTPAQALMMQEIAWEIVTHDSYSCYTPPMGIEEELSYSFEAFPNPFTETITLKPKQSQFENAQINISNSVGQLVKTISNVNGPQVTIHREELSQGFYTIQIIQQGQWSNPVKVLIQ